MMLEEVGALVFAILSTIIAVFIVAGMFVQAPPAAPPKCAVEQVGGKA